MAKKSHKHRADEGPGQGPAQPESPKSFRSGELLFRILSTNQVTLSQMADTKAHIMLTICAGVITLSMGRVFEPDSARYAAIVLVVFSLLSAFLAILSTLPRYGSPQVPGPDDPAFNVLFFNHFATLTEDEFAARMQRVISDGQAVRDALFRDIYRQGVVLARRKYRYLILCYRTFLVGIVASGGIWLWGIWQV